MTFFASPILAIGFGAFLLCAETCRHFESVLSLPETWRALPIHDWLAGLFLVYGGVRNQRDRGTGRLYQLTAWAFSVSLLCGAFFRHLEEWSPQTPEDGWISEPALVSIIGVLLAVSLCGLVSTMVLMNSRRRDEPA